MVQYPYCHQMMAQTQLTAHKRDLKKVQFYCLRQVHLTENALWAMNPQVTNFAIIPLDPSPPWLPMGSYVLPLSPNDYPTTGQGCLEIVTSIFGRPLSLVWGSRKKKKGGMGRGPESTYSGGLWPTKFYPLLCKEARNDAFGTVGQPSFAHHGANKRKTTLLGANNHH